MEYGSFNNSHISSQKGYNMLLEMKNITKTFPGVRALDDVNMSVAEGTIHAVCGENGAGKSTLMNVLSGIYPYGSYEGEIIYNGELCKFKNIKDSERVGIVIIHQELALVPELTIAENMFLGNEQAKNNVINWDDTNNQALKYMKIVGLNEKPTTLIKDINVGKQQLVEIAKALAKNVKLLILDEPTSSLNEKSSLDLLNLLISLKKDKGITSIMISHKLNEITYCADETTIIRDGKTIETLNHKIDDISEDRIIKGMVGREMNDRYPERKHDIGDIAFSVKNWTVHHPVYSDKKVVDNASINVRKGEIVGIAGLVGAGRSELAMSVFGKAYGVGISGSLEKYGKPVSYKNIKSAIVGGLAYVTEDRKGNGLVLSDNIKRNITITRPEIVSKNYVFDMDKETQIAKDTIREFGIKANDEEVVVGTLSGGNQQKVLVSKWIFSQPDVLIMDEPTRGVDVGAKYEIYEIMNRLVEAGKSIIMISSELPEVIGVSDRIYVMNEGKIIAEMPKEGATQEKIMSYILSDSNKGA